MPSILLKNRQQSIKIKKSFTYVISAQTHTHTFVFVHTATRRPDFGHYDFFFFENANKYHIGLMKID